MSHCSCHRMSSEETWAVFSLGFSIQAVQKKYDACVSEKERMKQQLYQLVHVFIQVSKWCIVQTRWCDTTKKKALERERRTWETCF